MQYITVYYTVEKLHSTLMLVILLSKPWSPKKPHRVLNFSGIFLKEYKNVNSENVCGIREYESLLKWDLSKVWKQNH